MVNIRGSFLFGIPLALAMVAVGLALLTSEVFADDHGDGKDIPESSVVSGQHKVLDAEIVCQVTSAATHIYERTYTWGGFTSCTDVMTYLSIVSTLKWLGPPGWIEIDELYDYCYGCSYSGANSTDAMDHAGSYVVITQHDLTWPPGYSGPTLAYTQKNFTVN